MSIPSALNLLSAYIEKGVMIPAFLLNSKEAYELVKSSGNYQVPSLDELNNALKILDISENNLFLSTNPITPFVYNRNLTYVDIQSLNETYLIMTEMKDRLHSHHNYIESLREEGEYSSIISITNKRYILSVFHEVYEKLDEDDKYSLFKDVYIHMEYGFQLFLPDVLEEVLELNFDTSFKKKLKTDNEGYVTIYRGVGSQSREANESYSWTTSEKVAKFFAYRFDRDGKIYKGKVHIDDIIDFIESRNEEEILVRPTDVYEIIEVNN